MGRFVEVCRRRMKVNAYKSKVMVLNGEDRLECEVHVDRILLEHISEFKYLGCVLDESGIDGAECCWKVASGSRVAVARDLELEYARVLHETLLISVLMYGSEAMLWKEKERSRIKAVQMYNLRGLLGFRRMDRVSSARVTELCGVKKGLDDGLMKACSGGSATWRGWRGIGLPRKTM